MDKPFTSLLLAACVFVALFASPSYAGSESTPDFVRRFLQRHPSFDAEGIMTSSLSGRPPYRCRVEISFRKDSGVTFRYNTNAARNIIPYDFIYRDRHLTEKVFNRERSAILSDRELGPPNRTVFNFVWDVMRESSQGAGFKSLLLSGLMSDSREDSPGRTDISLERRFPVIPIQRVIFSFDADLRLKSLRIFLADGSTHRIDIRRFRDISPSSESAPTSREDSAAS